MSESSSDDRILPGQMPKNASVCATLPRRRRLARRLAACAIAACAVALIVVSANFLFVSSGADDANGTSAGELADELAGAGAQEERSSSGAQSGQFEEDAASLAGASVDSEDAVSGAGAPGAADEGSVSGTGATSGVRDGASPGAGATSPGAGSSGSASSSGASGTGADAPYEGTVTVTVTVSSSTVGGGVSGSARPTFAQGATVYDALCATGLSVNAETTAYGIYVTAIGGLAQKEHGGKSGWMFSVNGTVPMTSCGNYVLHDGDNVQWYYVV